MSAGTPHQGSPCEGSSFDSNRAGAGENITIPTTLYHLAVRLRRLAQEKAFMALPRVLWDLRHERW
jgi:hypothetical protein